MKTTFNLPTVAYFSMEIALDPAIPTYSGGLGMLAGDTLRSAADIGAPLIAVTLVYREGYFRQRLDAAGNQSEEPQRWEPERVLAPVEGRITIEIERRPVVVRAWKYTVQGITGETVPVYLLDTNVPENAPEDRALTNSLYGGNQRYRLCQEAVLGPRRAPGHGRRRGRRESRIHRSRASRAPRRAPSSCVPSRSLGRTRRPSSRRPALPRR